MAKLEGSTGDSKNAKVRILKTSLYQCFNARVKDERIYCVKGYRIGSAKDGTLPVARLVRGEALVLSACQRCPDFDFMGDTLPPEERGWLTAAK